MACLDDDAILDLLDERLETSVRRRILQHLDDCTTCRGAVSHALRLLAPPADAAFEVEAFVVDRYVVHDWIGEGAMGVVYRAHDPRIDRDVALELVLPELSEASQRARLLQEARAMGRINHPNVLAVYDAGTVDDAVFVVVARPGRRR